MDVYHDSDGVLCISAKHYVERMVASYVMLFGTKPNLKVSSPLKKSDHPELDDTKFLDAKQMQQYQSLVGALQWAISIGHFNINTAVMSISSFHAMPHCGHFERVTHICGYLAKMEDAVL